jgi:hypothetical protein
MKSRHSDLNCAREFGLCFDVPQHVPLAPGHSLAGQSLPDGMIAGLGLIGFVAYLVWIMLFLRRIRPALAHRVGAVLGVTISEQPRGQWRAASRGPRGSGCAIALADISILLVGTLGPLVAFSLALLLLFGP